MLQEILKWKNFKSRRFKTYGLSYLFNSHLISTYWVEGTVEGTRIKQNNIFLS